MKQYLNGRSGGIREGNLNNGLNDENHLFSLNDASGGSFNGFAGVSEFSFFPLRQLFFVNHGRFASEWDSAYYTIDTIRHYTKKFKKNILFSHYKLNGKDYNDVIIYLGGKENLYLIFYNRSSFDDDDDRKNVKNGVVLLFSKKTKKIDTLIDELINQIIPKEKSSLGSLNILVQDSGNLYTKPIKVEKPEIDFSINYNKLPLSLL
jgi:hypothetical protein